MCFYGWLWCFIWTSGFIDSVCSRIIRGAFTEHAYLQAPTPWFSLVWDSPDKRRCSNLQVTVICNWDWKPLVNRNIQSNITLSGGTQLHARLSWKTKEHGALLWKLCTDQLWKHHHLTSSSLSFILFHCETNNQGNREGRKTVWVTRNSRVKKTTDFFTQGQCFDR